MNTCMTAACTHVHCGLVAESTMLIDCRIFMQAQLCFQMALIMPSAICAAADEVMSVTEYMEGEPASRNLDGHFAKGLAVSWRLSGLTH